MAGTSDTGGNWRMTTQIAMVLNVTKIQLNRDKGWMALQKDGITVTKLKAHLAAEPIEDVSGPSPVIVMALREGVEQTTVFSQGSQLAFTCRTMISFRFSFFDALIPCFVSVGVRFLGPLASRTSDIPRCTCCQEPGAPARDA